jgi:hypothetical protein
VDEDAVTSRAHTGKDETCPRRVPALPALKSPYVEPPPIEEYEVLDQVTHDKYGLGRVVKVEGDDAVVVDFGPRKVRILSPFARMTKL